MTGEGLTETSSFYRSAAETYRLFAEAEDVPGLIAEYLTPEVKGRIVLDAGCGTGKYAEILSPACVHYYGLDQAEDALASARAKLQGRVGISFIAASMEKIPLPDQSVDVVLSTWALSVIREVGRRDVVLREFARVMKPEGKLILVENDIGGEFETIRGRYPDMRQTAEYNDWVTVVVGLKESKKIDTYFQFKSVDEARRVIREIWGEKAATRLKSERIGHKVVVYSGTRSMIG